MSDIVIGIDLGTTNSCVSVYHKNKLKILENNEGDRITSSFVFFVSQDRLVVGQLAKKMADKKPENGVYEVKRLIGRQYDDPHVQKNLQYLPFEVQKGESNVPEIIISDNNAHVKKTSQEICTIILKKLKADAEAKLGHPVDKAVITVPAYFNMLQREATLAASEDAGFTVLQLLNEPTAAILRYYYENNDADKITFALGYDLGGGAFNVAILSCEGHDINIVGVDGDGDLGGHDFDNLLVEYLCQKLINEYDFNPKTDRRALRRLKNECEEAKRYLSSLEETNIVLDGLVSANIPITFPITRTEFETLASKLFTRTMEIVERCLKKSNLTTKDIKDVILSGGSTRIPKIRTMIQEYFGGKELCKVTNPDECVAAGAAIQAAMLSKDKFQVIKHIKITDVTPLSLGIKDFVGLMQVKIKRNTPIPVKLTTTNKTAYNNQNKMVFKVYEGERVEAEKNYFLGDFEVVDLTPAPPGQCKISFTMSIDPNGILKVSATETVSNKTKIATIAYVRGRRNHDEVARLVDDAIENQREDERFIRFADTKRYLIKYCSRIKINLEEKRLTFKYKDVYDKCTEALDTLIMWQVKNEKEMKQFGFYIVALCNPIVTKDSFKQMPTLK